MDCSPPGPSVGILVGISPPPGDLPDPVIKPASSTLAGGFFTTKPPGKPYIVEYSTATKREKLRIRATAWVSLKTIVLKEARCKRTLCTIPLERILESVKQIYSCKKQASSWVQVGNELQRCDGNATCFDCCDGGVGGCMFVHMSKLNKLFNLDICSLMQTSYTTLTQLLKC